MTKIDRMLAQFRQMNWEDQTELAARMMAIAHDSYLIEKARPQHSKVISFDRARALKAR